VQEGVRIQDVEIDGLGVRITLSAGTTIHASYVVDATGYKSVLADKLALRECPPRFRTNTRSIFTHMTGVKRYEDCSLSQSDPMMQRWSQGTLHHCFDGGWIWVIPFNNGPQSSNPLVSVGLQFDNRKYPFRGTPPEIEFKETISRFPSICEHFRDAVPARGWVSSFERLQYSSNQTIGDRWCLMSHAAGFLDPLFSRGLVLTMRTMLPTAEKLLAAVEDGDFSANRFAQLDDLHQRALDNVDVMVEGMYTSWRDFTLFDAFARFWYATGVLGFFQLEAAYSVFRRSGDRERLRDMLFGSYPGSLCSAFPQFQPYFADSIAAIQAVDAGTSMPGQGASKLIGLIREADFLPPGFYFGDLEKRHGGAFDVEHWRQIQTWGNYESPKEVKDSLYPGSSDENVQRFMSHVDASLQSERLAAVRSFIASSSAGR
jgi:FADH2 O2-dependent halogenase